VSSAGKLRASFSIWKGAGTNSIRTKLFIKNTGKNTVSNVVATITFPTSNKLKLLKGPAAKICVASAKDIKCTIGALDLGEISVLVIKYAGTTMSSYSAVITSSLASMKVTGTQMV